MAKKAKTNGKTAASFNRFKAYKGRRYTGMKIGRTHHWRYDQASWKERKLTPDKWELTFSTVKRRAGRAPKGSGAPVGTGYHWFILAHQYVEKLNANDYSTQMVGLKYKLAHKRAAKNKWNVSDEKQRKELIQILKNLIADLEKEPQQIEPVQLDFEHNKQPYKGTAIPILTSCDEGLCQHFDITLNKEHQGILRYKDHKWKITEIKSQALTNKVGEQIEEWYTEKSE